LGTGTQSVDLVVRGAGRRALVATTTFIGPAGLNVGGSLSDPDIGGGPPVPVMYDVRFDEQLSSGAHVLRNADFVLVFADGQESVDFSWKVTTLDRDEDFRLHDVQASADGQELRCFAIEDLAATVGVGIAGGLGLLWLAQRAWSEERERKRLDKRWYDCLNRGGKPHWRLDGSGEVELDLSGKLIMRSGLRYNVECTFPDEA